MKTDKLQQLLNECIIIEQGNYLGGGFGINLKECQEELDDIKQQNCCNEKTIQHIDNFTDRMKCINCGKKF